MFQQLDTTILSSFAFVEVVLSMRHEPFEKDHLVLIVDLEPAGNCASNLPVLSNAGRALALQVVTFDQKLLVVALWKWAVDQIEELILRDANLASHFLQQRVAEILGRSMARFGSHRSFLSVLGLVDEPDMITMVSLKAFFEESGFYIPFRSNRQPGPHPSRRADFASNRGPSGKVPHRQLERSFSNP